MTTPKPPSLPELLARQMDQTAELLEILADPQMVDYSRLKRLASSAKLTASEFRQFVGAYRIQVKMRKKLPL